MLHFTLPPNIPKLTCLPAQHGLCAICATGQELKCLLILSFFQLILEKRSFADLLSSMRIILILGFILLSLGKGSRAILDFASGINCCVIMKDSFNRGWVVSSRTVGHLSSNCLVCVCVCNRIPY